MITGSLLTKNDIATLVSEVKLSNFSLITVLSAITCPLGCSSAAVACKMAMSLGALEICLLCLIGLGGFEMVLISLLVIPDFTSLEVWRSGLKVSVLSSYFIRYVVIPCLSTWSKLIVFSVYPR